MYVFIYTRYANSYELKWFYILSASSCISLLYHCSLLYLQNVFELHVMINKIDINVSIQIRANFEIGFLLARNQGVPTMTVSNFALYSYLRTCQFFHIIDSKSKYDTDELLNDIMMRRYNSNSKR